MTYKTFTHDYFSQTIDGFASYLLVSAEQRERFPRIDDKLVEAVMAQEYYTDSLEREEVKDFFMSRYDHEWAEQLPLYISMMKWNLFHLEKLLEKTNDPFIRGEIRRLRSLTDYADKLNDLLWHCDLWCWLA